MKIVLRTRRLLLRPWNRSDLSVLHAHMSDPAVAFPAGFEPHETRAQTRKRLDESIREWRKSSPRQMAFLVARNDTTREPIGSIILRWPHKGVGHLGYWVGPCFRRRGYATEFVRKLVNFSFRDYDAHRVEATCWIGNPASAKVLRKAGLQREGCLRGYLRRGNEVRDEAIFGITKKDWKEADLSSTRRRPGAGRR